MRRLLLVLGLVVLTTVQTRAAVEKRAVDAAIERGVAGLKTHQGSDGSFDSSHMGATALAGMTLLECGVPKDDKSVSSAASHIRKQGFTCTHTYSLALGVMFLDRLDDPNDTPLIESMILRLLAGQQTNGVWSYECPNLAPEEIRRLQAEMAGGGTRVLSAGSGRDLAKMPAKGTRTVKDLAPEVRAQIDLINRGLANSNGGSGDNSNTQFATLALWIGRRYGIPTQTALLRIDNHFRTTQRPDGGWSYNVIPAGPAMGGPVPPGLGIAGAMGGGGTATMTCAGILGLAIGHGTALDIRKARDPKAEPRDVSKDANLRAGLQAVSTAIGNPIGWNGLDARPAAIPPASGKAFYFLWSLERIALALNLDTIGKKDWFNWGAEILLANQSSNGTWSTGEYGSNGADTCFALLFLKRVNLVRDLSGGIGGFKDPGARTIRAGGIGGAGLREPPPAMGSSGIGEKGKAAGEDVAGTGKPSRLTAPARGPGSTERPVTPESAATTRLSDELARATGERRKAMIEKLRDGRGVMFTEALVEAIGKLDSDGVRDARVALADRFTRLKDSTLAGYLKDEEPEIRRAAALAGAARGSKSLIPDLINRLDDREPLVQRAAHQALKILTSKDFGPARNATPEERKKAIADWLAWHKKNSS